MGALLRGIVVAVGTTTGILGTGIGLALAAGSAPSPVLRVEHVHVHMSTTAAEVPTTTVSIPPLPATVPTSTTLPTSTALPSAAATAPPQTAAGRDGTLSATLSVSPGDHVVGTTVSFVVSVNDSAATGTVGIAELTYGDGQPAPETGLAASCRAGTAPSPAAESFEYTHAYGTPGTYAVTVTVSDPCSSEDVVVALPITVGA